MSAYRIKKKISIKEGALILASLLLGAFVIFCIVICFLPGVPPPPEFVGIWESEHMHLGLFPDGDLEYARLSESGQSETAMNVSIRSWDDSGFEAGLWKFTTRFVIDQGPHETALGEWAITVDGQELTRVAP